MKTWRLLGNGSQTTNLQHDALSTAGVDAAHIYEDHASGRIDARPGLDATLKSLRKGDTLVVWKLDRLGRDLRHLVNTVYDLMKRDIGFKVLTGHGASIDTTTPSGKLVFGIFAALAEFEKVISAVYKAVEQHGYQLLVVQLVPSFYRDLVSRGSVIIEEEDSVLIAGDTRLI